MVPDGLGLERAEGGLAPSAVAQSHRAAPVRRAYAAPSGATLPPHPPGGRDAAPPPGSGAALCCEGGGEN
jgi:hypothetical protein